MTETNHTTQENLSRAKLLAKRHHEALWLGSRFFERPIREMVQAVLALDGELLRISQAVTEPTMGQIRFQWWIDQLDAYRNDNNVRLVGDAFLIRMAMRDTSDLVFDAISELMDRREMFFLKEIGLAESHTALFKLLNVIATGSECDADRLSALQASLYAVLDGEALEPDRVKELADMLADTPEKVWPILCVFALTGDWVHGERRSAFARRWRILQSFLSGEQKLAKRLRALASSLG